MGGRRSRGVGVNTVELSVCHSFGFIDLPFVNGFLGDTGLRGSWDFRSVIAHPGYLVQEFGEYRLFGISRYPQLIDL